LNDDDPLPLKDAAKRFGFPVSTLRAEHDRGRLTFYRIGKKLYTTVSDIRGMVEQCRVEPKDHASTLIRGASNTSSEMERVSSALAAANDTVTRLKSASRNTSLANTSPSHRVRH